MTDENKLFSETSRADHARRLLEDPLLVEAFATLDADYIQAWRDTGARDDDARQRLWQAVNILGKVKSHLLSVMQGGKLAQAELNEIMARRQRRPKPDEMGLE